jgi:hypothetical protein
MFCLTPLVLGALVLGVSTANSVGAVFIENRCEVAVNVWSVADVTNSTVNCLEPIIGNFKETYRMNPNGGGISLKIGTTSTDSDITQLEYTYRKNSSNVYYDISNVNGYPFKERGLKLSPSTPNCSSISCDPGVAICPDIYNRPTDNFATKSCSVFANLTLTLCPSQMAPMGTAKATPIASDSADKVLGQDDTGGCTYLWNMELL